MNITTVVLYLFTFANVCLCSKGNRGKKNKLKKETNTTKKTVMEESKPLFQNPSPSPSTLSTSSNSSPQPDINNQPKTSKKENKESVKKNMAEMKFSIWLEDGSYFKQISYPVPIA